MHYRHVSTGHFGTIPLDISYLPWPDPISDNIVQLVRRLGPQAYMIARTRFTSEVEALYRLGADEVIPAEYETAVEIFTRALAQYPVSQVDIDRLVTEIRSEGYKMFRSASNSAR